MFDIYSHNVDINFRCELGKPLCNEGVYFLSKFKKYIFYKEVVYFKNSEVFNKVPRGSCGLKYCGGGEEFYIV